MSLLRRLITAWPQVLRRTVANWRLMSTVVVGVLMASAIMAGTVLYFDALRELALRKALDKMTVNESNIIIKTDRGPTTTEERDKVVKAAEREIEARVAWLLGDRTTGVKTATLFLSEVGKEKFANTSNPRSFFGHMPRLFDHVTIQPGGRQPGDAPVSIQDGTPTVEAVVPFDAAQQFGVDVGDKLANVPYWSEVIPFIHIVITGTFTVNNPDDEIWYLNDRVFLSSTVNSFRTLPFYVTEQAYYEVVGATFRQMDSVYSWLLMVDIDRLNARNAALAELSIRTMDSRLSTNLFSYRQLTDLDSVLRLYDTRLFFSKLPMFVILILISVVILYYVITLSSLVVEQQKGEIVLLKSRGASAAQVLSVYVVEGITIAVLSIVVAPILAATVISALGVTPAFSGLSGGEKLGVAITPGAYVMSAVGGLLSFAALMIPAVQASRMSVATFRQQSARPYSQPFYQRFYLDVLLLIMGVLLLRQLSEQGSVVAVGVFGEIAVDQVLLAVPAVILVASALVLLRLFPLFMRVSSALLSSFLSAGLVLGIWQMARNPTHYARLSLLLILMAGLGIFAASFGGTLQRSFVERALYSTGTDIRIEGALINTLGSTRPIRESFEGLPAVQGVTLAFRGFGSDLSKIFADSYTMFAVEGDKIKDMGWFRNDFSETAMGSMLSALGPNVLPVGLELPQQAESIGVTVKADRPHPSVVVVARIKDANSRYFTYVLGALDNSQWKTLETSLTRTNRYRPNRVLTPTKPLTLVSFTVYETNGRNRLRAGSVMIDDIYTRTRSGETAVVESFDSVSEWSMLRAVPEAQADVIKSAEDGLNGSGAATFIWTEGRPLVSRGIFHGPPLPPIPVIASSRFLRINNHTAGETIEVSAQGHRLKVTLMDELDFFPTLDTFRKSYLLSDLDSLMAYTNLEATGGELRPNEIWMTTNGSTDDYKHLIATLAEGTPFPSRNIFDKVQALEDSSVDPLVDAGWRALLFVAFASVLVLSGLGFMVHAYVSFKSREIQFALMRTVGFSMAQLTTLVLLEQVLVIGAGLALGSWMGGRLGATMMPFLGHTDRGTQVLPPFVVDINWGTLALTYVAMGLLFAIIIAGVIFMVRRISLQRILRLGEV